MRSYYIYLISSLPMLHFGARPPFSFDKFIRMCKKLVPDSDEDILKASSINGEYSYKGIQPTLKKWRIFDTTLRNELVKIRASRKQKDSLRYMRMAEYTNPLVSHIAMNAYRNPSLLESEKILDMERWRLLDELAIGHYFDIDFLIAYAHKLLILERWERINTAPNPISVRANDY